MRIVGWRGAAAATLMGCCTLATVWSGIPVGAAPTAAPTTKIKVEDAAGKVLFALDPSDKGYRVEGPTGEKLGSVKVEADRVKVADAAGKPAFKVKQKGAGFKLYREPGAPGGADVELLDVESSASGLRIRDAGGAEMFKGKAVAGKMKVSGAGLLWDLKTKAGEVEVESAGKRVIRLKGMTSLPAAVICASPRFKVLEKAAVAAYSARIGP